MATCIGLALVFFTLVLKVSWQLKPFQINPKLFLYFRKEYVPRVFLDDNELIFLHILERGVMYLISMHAHITCICEYVWLKLYLEKEYTYGFPENFLNGVIVLTVYGVEYAFGAHDYSTSGVFEVEPRQCPGFKFRKSIFMGTTSLDPFQIREFMERQSANYNGDAYHLIVKNCNHFCEDICYKLTGNSIPKWVNRLARIGMQHVF